MHGMGPWLNPGRTGFVIVLSTVRRWLFTHQSGREVRLILEAFDPKDGTIIPYHNPCGIGIGVWVEAGRQPCHSARLVGDTSLTATETGSCVNQYMFVYMEVWRHRLQATIQRRSREPTLAPGRNHNMTRC